LGQVQKGVQDHVGASLVEAGGGLVQQNDPGVSHQGPGHGQPLAFPAREGAPLLADRPMDSVLMIE